MLLISDIPPGIFFFLQGLGEQKRILISDIPPGDMLMKVMIEAQTMIHRRLAKLNELEERRKKKEERNISELRKGLYARTTQLFTAVL